MIKKKYTQKFRAIPYCPIGAEIRTADSQSDL